MKILNENCVTKITGKNRLKNKKREIEDLLKLECRLLFAYARNLVIYTFHLFHYLIFQSEFSVICKWDIIDELFACPCIFINDCSVFVVGTSDEILCMFVMQDVCCKETVGNMFTYAKYSIGKNCFKLNEWKDVLFFNYTLDYCTSVLR